MLSLPERSTLLRQKLVEYGGFKDNVHFQHHTFHSDSLITEEVLFERDPAYVDVIAKNMARPLIGSEVTMLLALRGTAVLLAERIIPYLQAFESNAGVVTVDKISPEGFRLSEEIADRFRVDHLRVGIVGTILTTGITNCRIANLAESYGAKVVRAALLCRRSNLVETNAELGASLRRLDPYYYAVFGDLNVWAPGKGECQKCDQGRIIETDRSSST